jgi:hypothetical protein
VPAIVDDVDDPTSTACQAAVPWMAEKYVSDWSRVAHAGAGKDRGFHPPEVGDEVLVSFDQGEVRRRSCWAALQREDNPKTARPVPRRLDPCREQPSVHIARGHQLVFIDADDHCGIVLPRATAPSSSASTRPKKTK